MNPVTSIITWTKTENWSGVNKFFPFRGDMFFWEV